MSAPDSAGCPTSQLPTTRLQRALARSGIASRRGAEALILAGRVAVNGAVVRRLGTRVDPRQDRITVDGRPVEPAVHDYLALHKPAGYVTTRSDPLGRPTVMELAPPVPGLVPVGRLDVATEGLLLLTNDGDWAQRAGHPRFGLEKEYIATVRGTPRQSSLRTLRLPMDLGAGDLTTGAGVALLETTGSVSRLRLLLHEGRNRQVRRMLLAVGHPVLHLVRIRIGPIRLGALPAGRWRRLTEREVARVGGPGRPDQARCPA